MEGEVTSGQWHLDRRVPIAMITAILFQTGALIWWASDLSGRVGRLEGDLSKASDQRDRIVRLETVVDGQGRTLSRIEQKIDAALTGKTTGD